jgi:hypothetical protein
LFLQLSLTALNSSKSAYACFCLDGADFFDEYLYSSNFSERKRPDGVVEARFTCQVYNKVYFDIQFSQETDVLTLFGGFAFCFQIQAS